MDMSNIREIKTDANGNIIYYKNNINGYTEKSKYDENNNLVSYKDSEGIARKYDKKGRLILEKDSEDEKEWKYDKNGNLVYHRDTSKCEVWWKKYNSKGLLVFYKHLYYIDPDTKYKINDPIDSSSWEICYLEEYDSNGNLIHYVCEGEGEEWWKKYDNQNREIYYKCHNDFQIEYEYTEFGSIERWTRLNLDQTYATFGEHPKYEYYELDHNNKILYYKDSNGVEKGTRQTKDDE